VELGRAGVPLEVMQAVHDLKNWEIRQAAINAGIDLGQKHVGSRAALGPEQVARQDLIDQMIRDGVKPEDIPRLAQQQTRQIPWQRNMPQPRSHIGPSERQVGITTPSKMAFVLNVHELGHNIFAHFGDLPVTGMVTHLHRELNPGSRGATLVDMSRFLDAQGNLDAAKVRAEPEVLINLGVAGAAMNEVVNGIPAHQNPGMGGDMRGAADVFDAMGFTYPDQMQALWDAGVARVIAEINSIPGLADLVREEARKREENLPAEHLFSQNRIDKINARARALRDAARQQQQQQQPQQIELPGVLSGNAPGVPAQGSGGNPQAVAGGQGGNAPAGAGLPPVRTPLKPFKAPDIDFSLLIRDQRTGIAITHRVVTAKSLNQAMTKLAKLVPPRRGWVVQVLGEHQIGPPVQQIPFAIKGERPFEPMVDPRTARREVEVKEDQDERGLPVNPLRILIDPETGERHAFGGIADMSKVPPKQIKEIFDERKKQWLPDAPKWRTFWEDWRKALVENFRGETDRITPALSLTQRKGGPVPGMNQLLKVLDIHEGFPPDKPAMGVKQIREALEGKTPTSGAGRKIHDMADSISGVTTRTFMGRDPRGLQPSAGDTHALRAVGYVDEPLLNFIREKWGPEEAKRWIVDLKSPSAKEGRSVSGGVPDRYQYERANEVYNAVKDEYIRSGDDQNLLASMVQSEQWGAFGRSMDRNMQLPAQMIAENTRRTAFEVKPTANSPYGQFWGPVWNEMSPREQAAVTRAVMPRFLEILREEAGGKQLGHFIGPGGFEGEITPSVVHDLLGSRAAGARLAALAGQIFEQGSVLQTKPQMSAGSHFLELREIGSDLLRSHNNAVKFWAQFREHFPQAQGFQPVRGEVNGIRIVRIGGHLGLTSGASIEAIGQAIARAGEAVGIDTIEWAHGPADARMIGNNWQAHPAGEQYEAIMEQRGKPGLVERVRNQYKPEIREILEKYLGKYRGP
jgi:hypothetical protein